MFATTTVNVVVVIEISHPTSFNSETICRACRNISEHNIGRYALSGCVEEGLWMGEPTDVDIDDFVRRHNNDIVATLNAAIDKHMYVSL